jgi:hypothetical protein
MKFHDIELPADLQDRNKGLKLIEDNNKIILNLDDEYSKIRVRSWPGGPRILAFIPEEFRANWDKESDWFLRANNLFDEVFKSSSIEGHYKYNIIQGDWKHNFAEHYKSQMCIIRRLKQIMEIVRNRPSREVRDKAQIYMNKLLDMGDDFR